MDEGYNFLQSNNTEECILQLVNRMKILELEAEETMQSRLSFFLMLSAFNIFLMQVGFAMLEVGTVQTKNAKSVLFKNIIDCCAGAIVWWFWGYGISNGTYRDLWKNHLAYSLGLQEPIFFFHSFTFSTTCATIMSGGVVERMGFTAYMTISATMVGFIYPFTVSWVWNEEGWLNTMGYIDFAGASVVHALGGVATFVACYILGPRIGRFHFDEEAQKWKAQKFTQHSAVFANLGTFILFFGWMSFNASSTLGARLEDFELATRAVINSMLSGAASCVAGSIYFRKRDGVHNLEKMHNSLLIGLVSVTGCCAYVDFYAAPLIGLVACGLYDWGSRTMVKIRVDDPLDAVAVHGIGGVWGTIATGLFLNPIYSDGDLRGLFHGGGRLLLLQFMGILVILAWGGCIIGFTLASMKKISTISNKIPNIRAERDAEILGLDFAYYDGFLFPELNKAAIAAHNESKAAKTRVIAKQLREKQNQPYASSPMSAGTGVPSSSFGSQMSCRMGFKYSGRGKYGSESTAKVDSSVSSEATSNEFLSNSKRTIKIVESKREEIGQHDPCRTREQDPLEIMESQSTQGYVDEDESIDGECPNTTDGASRNETEGKEQKKSLDVSSIDLKSF